MNHHPYSPPIAALMLALGLHSGIACAGGDAIPAAGVKHVVLCWLKEPGNALHAARVIQISNELRNIPGILDLAAGTAVPSDRPVVDDSFDVGIVITFADAAGLQAYLDHPEHVSRVRDTLRPLCARVQIYDIRY